MHTRLCICEIGCVTRVAVVSEFVTHSFMNFNIICFGSSVPSCSHVYPFGNILWCAPMKIRQTECKVLDFSLLKALQFVLYWIAQNAIEPFSNFQLEFQSDLTYQFNASTLCLCSLSSTSVKIKREIVWECLRRWC